MWTPPYATWGPARRLNVDDGQLMGEQREREAARDESQG
jgi:hypothetical protein